MLYWRREQAFALIRSMLYCIMREANVHWQTRWLALAQHLQLRLAKAGLGEIAQAVGQALKPLAPFAAQVLWFSQPGFALFGQSEAISSLADLLDNPEHSEQTIPPETGE